MQTHTHTNTHTQTHTHTHTHTHHTRKLTASLISASRNRLCRSGNRLLFIMEKLTSSTRFFNDAAMALTVCVLPVPLGPKNSTTRPRPYDMISSRPLRLWYSRNCSNVCTDVMMVCFWSSGRMTWFIDTLGLYKLEPSTTFALERNRKKKEKGLTRVVLHFNSFHFGLTTECTNK